MNRTSRMNMLAWITRRKYRFPLLVIGYFATHVIIRSMVSGALSFDESEQAFLSQWIHLGYNSQPPLYTWVQAGLFETIGYSVASLAVLKNVLLLFTYLLVYEFVVRATGNRLAAVVSSLGMLTMPQIAWESHRDLSHTVAVTFATALLIYVIVRLQRERTLFWYAMIGVATGIGLMSKYNFTITIVALVAAAATVPKFRKALLDARLGISVVIALLIIGPHAIWMLDHVGLASSKTVSQLSSSQPLTWGNRVWLGSSDLFLSTLSCSVVTVALFGICMLDSRYRPRFLKPIPSDIAGSEIPADQNGRIEKELLQLVERFLMFIGIALLLIVAAGYAIKIKNHWLHPYIFLIPTYITLKALSYRKLREHHMNRICWTSAICAVTILVATAVKPMAAGVQSKYALINFPYDQLSDRLQQRFSDGPSLIVAPNMRIAGNLRLQFPDTPVLSQDNEHLQIAAAPKATDAMLVVSDSTDPTHRAVLAKFASKRFGAGSLARLRWETVSLPYQYTYTGDEKEFYVATLMGTRMAKGPVEEQESNERR